MSIANDLLTAFNAYAGRVAISQGERNVTYGALHRQSLQVAAYLRQRNLKNAFIAIEVDNIADHIAAILGVVISGNCYVSVTAENSAFVANSSLPIALTITTDSKQRNGVSFYDILKSDAADAEISIEGGMNMCAFFTSGSTGQSKAIVHQHKNIFNDTWRQINDNQITQADKIDLVFSLSFSASLACIYPALLTGAELCIFDLKTEGLTLLADFWERKAITFSTLSVSSFQGICKTHPSLQHLAALRFISISAEPVKDTTISLFQSTFAKGVTLQIAYASTETRTISEMKVVNDGAPLIYPDAIGKPVSGKIVHIVDEEDNDVPAGATGQIVVESAYIATGYYGQPEESEQSFTLKENLVYYKTGDLGCFNNEGYLFYQGRLKSEHKLNGVKINLLDIEQQIEKVKGIFKVAVVINKSDTEQPKLACFYEVLGDADINSNIIKQAIANSLPASHIPHFFIATKHIPLTHSGKTDRKKLEVFDTKAHLSASPALTLTDSTSADEQTVINIFKHVLQLDNVGLDTDFFDAGGDSMSSLICVADVELHFKVSLSITSLVDNPTARKLAAYLSDRQASNTIIEIKNLNEYNAGKRNAYIISNGRNSYNKLAETSLAVQFNLIELVYDMFGSADNADHPKLVLDELAQVIGKNPNSIVIGMSFNGYIAHQLACLLPGVDYCVMLDTFDYFEFDKYVDRPQSKKAIVATMLWHVFKNGDLTFPLYFLKRRKETLLAKKQRLALPLGQTQNIQMEKFIENINFFTASLQHKTTLNNCIYFQASRFKKDISKSWRSKIGGRFYYQPLHCTHSDILDTKATRIAQVITKTVNAK